MGSCRAPSWDLCCSLFLQMTCHSTCRTAGLYADDADDAQFLDTDTPQNFPALKERIERNLSLALDWFTQNRLKINPSKTEFLLLKSRHSKTTTHFSIRFGKSEIIPVPSVKVLGVTVDSNLVWDRHVSHVIQRCFCVLIGLARIRRRMPRQTRQLLIEALVFPHLQYCMAVWGGCGVTLQKRLQKCINFGVRIVTDLSRRDRVTQHRKELGWPSIGELICERDLNIMFRLLHGTNAPELIRRHITHRADVSSRSTRASDDGQLEVPRARTEFARRSFLCRASRAWNGLSSRVRSSPNLPVFRRRLCELR